MSKKYIVFGATGSIGSALVDLMYEDNIDCHLVAKNENEVMKLSNKTKYTYSVCDVLEINFLDKLSKDLNETEILGVAYCIGSIDIKPLKMTETKDFISSYVLNLAAAANIIKTFQENLKKNNGSVVLYSTVAAKKGFINHSIISSSKAAVEGLTVALAAELAPHIRVNCIAPSLTKSKMSNFLIKNTKSEENIAKVHPLKRIGLGMDSAKLTKFLLSKNSAWITGQIIGVDGGRSSIA